MLRVLPLFARFTGVISQDGQRFLGEQTVGDVAAIFRLIELGTHSRVGVLALEHLNTNFQLFRSDSQAFAVGNFA
jgi:hypothetical protein